MFGLINIKFPVTGGFSEMQQSIYFSVIVSIVSYVEYILICFFAVYLKIFLYFLLPTLSIYIFCEVLA